MGFIDTLKSNGCGGFIIPEASAKPLPPAKIPVYIPPKATRKAAPAKSAAVPAKAAAPSKEMAAALAGVMAYKNVPSNANGLPRQVVAAITAAVAAYTGGKGIVTGISKAASAPVQETALQPGKKQRRIGNRGSWGQAGVVAVTAPF